MVQAECRRGTSRNLQAAVLRAAKKAACFFYQDFRVSRQDKYSIYLMQIGYG
jgi:hypothetical protein